MAMKSICENCTNRFDCQTDSSAVVLGCDRYCQQPDYSKILDWIIDQIAEKVAEKIQKKEQPSNIHFKFVNDSQNLHAP